VFYLTPLAVTKVMTYRWWLSEILSMEWYWQGKPNYWSETCLDGIMSIIYTSWTGLGSQPFLWIGRVNEPL